MEVRGQHQPVTASQSAAKYDSIDGGLGGWEGLVLGQWGGQAPPNNWSCGPSVIRQFAPPLAPIEGGYHRLPATLRTSRGLGSSGGHGLGTQWHNTKIQGLDGKGRAYNLLHLLQTGTTF